jgi:hypothetical protein
VTLKLLILFIINSKSWSKKLLVNMKRKIVPNNSNVLCWNFMQRSFITLYDLGPGPGSQRIRMHAPKKTAENANKMLITATMYDIKESPGLFRFLFPSNSSIACLLKMNFDGPCTFTLLIRFLSTCKFNMSLLFRHDGLNSLSKETLT